MNRTIHFREDTAIHVLTPQVIGIPWLADTNLAEHARDNDFNVLVVNDNTLGAINFLNFGNQVILYPRLSKNIENIVRVDRSIGQRLTLFHFLSSCHSDVLTMGYEVFLFATNRVFDN